MFGLSFGWSIIGKGRSLGFAVVLGVRERWDGSLCRNVQFAPALAEVLMPDADHDR